MLSITQKARVANSGVPYQSYRQNVRKMRGLFKINRTFFNWLVQAIQVKRLRLIHGNVIPLPLVGNFMTRIKKTSLREVFI